MVAGRAELERPIVISAHQPGAAQARGRTSDAKAGQGYFGRSEARCWFSKTTGINAAFVAVAPDQGVLLRGQDRSQDR